MRKSGHNNYSSRKKRPSSITSPYIVDEDALPKCLKQGIIQLEKGRFTKAENHYKKQLKNQTDPGNTYALLANLAFNTEKYDHAIKLANQSLHFMPFNAEARYILAKCHQKAGNIPLALSIYTQSSVLSHPGADREIKALLARFPDEAIRIYTEKSHLYISLNKYFEALQTLLDALENNHEEDTDLWSLFAQIMAHLRFNNTPEDKLLEYLTKAFEKKEIQQQNLAKAAISAIRFSRDCRDFFTASITTSVFKQLILEEQIQYRLAGNKLFRNIMNTCLITDVDFEERLTCLRRALLDLIHEKKLLSEEASLQCITLLAQQCFYNEYVFSVTNEETKQIEELISKITLQAEPEKQRSLYLAIVAAYQPISEIENISNASPFDDPILETLLTEQIRKPLEEQAIRETIKCLKNIAEDSTSNLVRTQYEEHPFPRWKKYPCPKIKQTFVEYLHGVISHSSVLPQQTGDSATEILVAGCGTGLIPNILYSTIKNINVTAVDLSKASLAYAIRQTREAGNNNIEYIQGDILDLELLGRKFDHINCYGVLHHMKSILDGWQVLNNILKPGGTMLIGLYSKIARRHLKSARVLVEKRGYQPDANDMRLCRQDLIRQQDNESIKAIVSSSAFYSMSNFRDLVFHYHEIQINLEELSHMLSKLGLIFLGFEHESPATAPEYRRLYPGDPTMTSLENWAEYESSHPDTFENCYKFWVYKPEHDSAVTRQQTNST